MPESFKRNKHDDNWRARCLLVIICYFENRNLVLKGDTESLEPGGLKTYIFTVVISIDNLTTHVKPTVRLVFKIDFQKVDQHAECRWLIHNTKRRKDNQLQSLKLPCTISKLSS